MKTGWMKVSGKWYYAYSSGALAINTTTPDGYRVNYNGEWVGWFYPQQKYSILSHSE